MRSLILPLCLLAGPAWAGGPSEMYVVVHSRDKIVHEVVCDIDAQADPGTPVLRTVVVAAGGLYWHVAGGVAPYTVVRDDSSNPGGGCITVMDAEGTVATGCGVVATQAVRIAVDCMLEREEPSTFGLVPNDSTDLSQARHPGRVRPIPGPVGPLTPDMPVAPTPAGPGPGPAPAPGPITYRPPVKTPPAPPLPPTPRTPLPVKDELRHAGTGHGTPAPRPRMRPVRNPQATPARSAAAPARSTGTTYHRPAPRPATPAAPRTPAKAPGSLQ